MRSDPSPESPVPFGRYQLIRRIGAGGMGEVFLAREVSGPLPRACVVKKVLPDLSSNRAFVGRFLDESKVVVRLKHPNIARVYAMGEEKGEYFLTMEYVQGKTVSRFARRLRELNKKLSLGEILLLGERVCQGLAYAHNATDERGASMKLVHRDLSPANVCISYRGEVKIIDFGAAQSTLKEEHTAPRVVIGNLTYMAPEQARKQPVDGRADVYSVGVLLWELLAWLSLPQKGDPIERWRRAANPVWEPPSRHREGLPSEVDDAILKAMRKPAAERYDDAAQFAAELARLRARHAPRMRDQDLGAALCEAFRKEKATEDAVLEEAMRGVAIGDMPTVKTHRAFFAPPNSLAFEHRALSAPQDYDPGSDDVTTNARPPRALSRDSVRATRVGFGVNLEAPPKPFEKEVSLIEEIESVLEDHPPPRLRWGSALLIAVTVFLAAAGLGFLGVWLWVTFGMTLPVWAFGS